MEVTTGAFGSAIEYLKTFAEKDSKVLFTPQGKLVVVSVRGPIAYGEYWMSTTSPLVERFALQWDRLPLIAKEIDDGELGTLRYEKQSNAMFEANRRKWWLPFVDPPDSHRPVVKQMIHEESRHYRPRVKSLTWTDTWLEALAVVESSVGSGSCRWQNLQLQRKGNWRWMASTNADVFTIKREREASDEGNMSLLVHHKYVPHLRAIGWSRQKVVIREGFRLLELECGKRRAIIVKAEAEFPSWQVMLDQQGTSTGGATVAVDGLLKATRRMSVIGSSMTMRTNDGKLMLFSKNDSGESDDVAIPLCTWIGRFSPVRVSTGYMTSVLSAWPTSEVTIETEGSEQPILLSAGETKTIIATIKGVHDETREERSEPAVA